MTKLYRSGSLAQFQATLISTDKKLSEPLKVDDHYYHQLVMWLHYQDIVRGHI